MKRILIIIANMFLSSFMMTIFAQLPNEEITILKSPNNDQSLTISCPEIPDACYQWSGPGVPSGAHTPSIVVYPQLGENVYHAVRTSKYGCEEKYVTVNVVGCISLDVEPLVECYPSGATVNRYDFNIKTSPPGYEDLVTVTPDHVSNNGGAPVETEDITFSIMHNRACASKTVQVNVINDNLGGSHQGSLEFENWIRTFNTVNEKLNYIKGKINSIKNLMNLNPLIQCEPTISFTLNTPQYRAISSCCDGKVGYGFVTAFPGLSASVGVECAIAITTFKIPYVFEPSIILGCNAFVNFHDATIKYVNEGCSDVVIPIKFGFSLSGGARLNLITVPNNKRLSVISVNAKLVGTASAEWEWIISKPIQWPSVTLSASFEAEASLLNIFKYKYCYKFASVRIL